MNVTYYNRPKMEGAFSEEAVFKIIKNHLPADAAVSDFYCSERWGRSLSLFEAGKHQGDVNHITGDVFHLALALKGRKTIITVHDIGRYERSLQGVKKIIWKYYMHVLPFNKCRFLTTVSEFTKTRILEYFSLPPEKITVIHNPAPPDFSFTRKNFNEQNPRVLQIGSGEQKNLFRLIKAIEGLNVQLLLIREKDADIEKKLRGKNIKYEWLQNISRKKVYECYKKCDMVFFASEYEGFGLPILEAQTVGRPVITSNVASMPEVAGEGALLVNPFKVDEIRKALLAVKNNVSLRNELVEKGQENLKRFVPEKIANQYANLYKEVAAELN